MTSLRLFKAWSPAWDWNRRHVAFQKLKDHVETTGASVLLGTPVSCDEAGDELAWRWTKELIELLQPQHIMGLAVGNELEILQFKDSVSEDCVRKIWDGGYYWRRFLTTASDLDALGYRSIRLTAVFTGFAMVGSPFYEVPGKGLVNTLLTNATSEFGSRFAFTFNIYPYFDPNILLDNGTSDQCQEALMHNSCWDDDCHMPVVLRLVRNKMRELTQSGEELLWLGETGWSAPMSKSLQTRMMDCPAWSSYATFRDFYKGFLSWDLSVGGGVKPPDHVFWFTLRDSVNFGDTEHFGLIESCDAPQCKLHGESYEVARYQQHGASSNRYCGNSPSLFDEFSQGPEDCRNKCTLLSSCRYYSVWETNWCRLTEACSWTVAQGTHSIKIYEKLFVEPLPDPSGEDHFQLRQISSEYCTDQPNFFEGFSRGHEDCRAKCKQNAACQYYSIWNTHWCKLTASCSTGQLGSYTIAIFERVVVTSTITATTTTGTATFTTATAVAHAFQLHQGPGNRYCSDSPALYEGFANSCEEKCSKDSFCEFYSSWTTTWCRTTATCGETAQLESYSIEIYRKVPFGWEAQLEFIAAGGGAARACRGASSFDNSDAYFTLFSSTPSLQACKARCKETPHCIGIEYHSGGKRCEAWTREGGIEATFAADGYVCLHARSPQAFPAMDGGENRACRGAHKADNSASYFVALSAASLEGCKGLCLDTPGCRGIEFGGMRCEVWTRDIEASAPVNGSNCLRYQPEGRRLAAKSPGQLSRGERNKIAAVFAAALVLRELS